MEEANALASYGTQSRARAPPSAPPPHPHRTCLALPQCVGDSEQNAFTPLSAPVCSHNYSTAKPKAKTLQSRLQTPGAGVRPE